MKFSQMQIKTLARWACMLGMLAFAGTAFAVDYYQKVTMPGTKSWNDPNDGATPTPLPFFGDSQAVHSGADYFIGRDRSGAVPPGMTAGTQIVLRTPGTAATFLGDSLTVSTDGDLRFKQSTVGVSTLFTISNFSLIGNGIMDQGTANTTAVLAGSLRIADTPTIKVGDDQNRALWIDALISGTGKLILSMAPTNGVKTLRFNNNGNTFSGTMEQTSGTLELNGATVLGQTRNLTLFGQGKLNPLVDVTANATTLTLNKGCQLILKKQASFANAIINGKKLAAGTYRSSDLQTSFTGLVTNDGGTLLVTAAGKVSASPSPVVFDSIQITSTPIAKSTKVLTITNTGIMPLNFLKQGSETYQGLVLSGFSRVTIKSVSPATTSPLAPGASLTVTLEFAPAAGDYILGGGTLNLQKTTLSIFSDDPTSPKTDVVAQGYTVPVEMSGFSAE